MDLSAAIVTLAILLAITLSVINRKLMWQSLITMTPFVLLGFIFVMVTAAADSGRGLTLLDNLRSIVINTVLLIRNGFMAATGLMLLMKSSLIKPPRSWIDWGNTLDDIPLRSLLGIIFGFALYSILLFSLLAPKILEQKAVGFYHIASVSGVVLLTAVNEELFYRLFIIGVLMWFIQRFRWSWWGAIVISATVWSYSHWFIADLGWIKFVQIFPLGILVGVWFRRYGFESCVLLHCCVNVAIIFAFQMV